MTAPTARPLPRMSPAGRRAAWIVLGLAAILGLLIGLGALRLHVATDPLADVHAYYDAGARLNAGLPLYDQPATTDDAAYYRYPPLLAILFRPLALLPFDAAAAIWELLLVTLTVATFARLGWRRRSVILAAGMLAMPILWTLAIGQAQAVVTFLLAVGSPAAVALAGHLKLTPWLVAIFWVARRDRRAVARFVGWAGAIGLVQLVLAPADTLAYLSFSSLDEVGEVVNLSPFAVSPALWAVMVATLAVVAWRLAPTRWGWAAAVVLSVASTPRLLAYQLSTLLACLGGPRGAADEPRGTVGEPRAAAAGPRGAAGAPVTRPASAPAADG